MQVCIDHSDSIREWHERSNNLVVLQVPDEQALVEWQDRLTGSGCPVVAFHEPDLDDAITALALVPGALTGAVSSLPLAGKELAMSG